MNDDIDSLWQMLQGTPDDAPDDAAIEEPEDITALLAEMNDAASLEALNGVDYARATPLTDYMTTLDEATLAHIAIRIYDMVRNRTDTWHQRRLHDWVDNHPILLDRHPTRPLSKQTIDYYANLDN